MVDAPYEQQEQFGREADDALGLQDLRKIGEVRGEEQRDLQQCGKGERPVRCGGTHGAEDACGHDCGGCAEGKAEGAQQHIGGEDRVARLYEDGEPEDDVGQCAEGSRCDGERRDGVGDVEPRGVTMPVRGDGPRT